MEKPQKAIVTDEGHLYLLKRPLYKQGLFWSTLVLAVISFLLFIELGGVIKENQAIHSALERAGMYYDSDDDDIYNYLQSWDYDLTPVIERVTSTTVTVVEQVMEDPNQVVQTAIEPALADIKQAAKTYVGELEGLANEIIVVEELPEEDITDISESLESYRGYINISLDVIASLYEMKAEEDRSFTEEEVETIQEGLASLLYDVTEEWENSLELTDSHEVL